MPAKKTTEVAVRDTSAVDMLMGQVVPDDMDSEQIQRAISERILSADSLEKILADDSSIATKDIVGRPLRVEDVALRRSDIEESRGTYMLIHAVDMGTGEVILANTSSVKIMSQLYQVKRLGLLPVEVAVKEIGDAQRGKHAPLGLEAIGRTLAQMTAAG